MTQYIYRAHTHNVEIARYELVSKTEKTATYIVLVRSYQGTGRHEVRRSLLRSNHDKFHDTWDDARAYLVQRVTRDIEAALDRLNAANATLAKVVALTEPKEWA